MKQRIIWMAVFILLVGLSVRAGTQVADKAVCPVCGATINVAEAKWTADHNGKTYSFGSEKCKEAFLKDPEKFQEKKADVAPAAKEISESKESGAACCPKMAHVKNVQAQAQTAAAEKAEKATLREKAKEAVPPAPCAPPAPPAPGTTPPTQGGCPMMSDGVMMWGRPMMMNGPMRMGMMMPRKHMMMGQGGPMGPGMRARMGLGMRPGMGPWMGMGMGMMEDVEKKVETTKDGVVITITSKNPETVKKIQEHIAAMAKREAEMMEMMEKARDGKEIKVEIKEEKKIIL